MLHTARQQILAPWSIYPFSAADCAALICDLLIFETATSDQALFASFERAGLQGEVLLTPTTAQLVGATDVVRAHLGTRALTSHAYGLGVLLCEMAEPDTLTRGSAELLRMARRQARDPRYRPRSELGEVLELSLLPEQVAYLVYQEHP